MSDIDLKLKVLADEMEEAGDPRADSLRQLAGIPTASNGSELRVRHVPEGEFWVVEKCVVEWTDNPFAELRRYLTGNYPKVWRALDKDGALAWYQPATFKTEGEARTFVKAFHSKETEEELHRRLVKGTPA